MWIYTLYLRMAWNRCLKLYACECVFFMDENAGVFTRRMKRKDIDI